MGKPSPIKDIFRVDNGIKKYSIEELKELLQVKDDNELIDVLIKFLLESIPKINAKSIAGDNEYLVNCADHVKNIVRESKNLDFDTINKSLDICKSVTRQGIRALGKGHNFWRPRFYNILEILEATSKKINYDINYAANRSDYEFACHMIFEEKRLSAVKKTLKYFPSIINSVDHDNKSLFYNIVKHYVELIKSDKSKESYFYFERLIRLMWYKMKFNYTDEERNSNLESINAIISNLHFYMNREERERNQEIIARLKVLKSILSDKDRRFSEQSLSDESQKILFEGSFSDTVSKEIHIIKREDTTEDFQNRVNYTKRNVFTIDSRRARTLDDGLSIERLPNGGYILGIHIADVSHYVKENSAIDKEAFKRTSTLYLPSGVIPMIPSELSNGLCSLNPNIYRRVISLFVQIDQSGNMIRYSFKKNVIQSKGKFIFDDVSRIVAGNQNAELQGTFKDFLDLSYILREKSNNNFIEDSEISEILGPDLPKDCNEMELGAEMVATYMLYAHKLIAAHFSGKLGGRELPIIYRVNPKPDPVILARRKQHLERMLQTNRITQELYRSFVEAISRFPTESTYSVTNIGHYSLNVDAYTHCTSPLRRYVDLMNQRAIKIFACDDTWDETTLEIWNDKLSKIANQTNVINQCQSEIREHDDGYALTKRYGN